MVADSLSRPPQTAEMNVRVCKEDSDYAYTSESDTSDSVSDDCSSIDEEPLISPEIFNEESNNTNRDVISSNIIDKKAIAILQSKESGLMEEVLKKDKIVEYLQPENLAVVKEVGNKRDILPENLRLTAFNLAHDRLHLGIDKTIEAIAKDFYWPNLTKDVTHWVKSCDVCQATKVNRHNRPKNCLIFFGQH